MKILLCSYFKFPVGDAGAIRHEKLAYMLQALGHEVYVVGLGAHCGFQTHDFRGIAYTSLRENDMSFKGKARSRLLYWRRLRKILDTCRPDVVLMDDLRPIATMEIKGYCRKHDIRLIHDSVEWYSPEQFRFGPLALSFINKTIINRYLVDRSMSVISISSYLHDYYSSKGIRSAIIPIVLVEQDLCREKHLDKVVQFMYAGQAGKKDNLPMVIEAFSMLPKDLFDRFRLHIVGCTEEQLIASGISTEQLELLRDHIEIHGRIPHGEVLELLKEIDFTMLMRSPVQRYAKAGFPTKVPESLSRSTPVVANITSDLGNYLEDGYNALIVRDYNAVSLADAFGKAIRLPLEERNKMCENAYETAAEKLYYRMFIQNLERVIGNV